MQSVSRAHVLASSVKKSAGPRAVPTTTMSSYGQSCDLSPELTLSWNVLPFAACRLAVLPSCRLAVLPFAVLLQPLAIELHPQRQAPDGSAQPDLVPTSGHKHAGSSTFSQSGQILSAQTQWKTLPATLFHSLRLTRKWSSS